MTKQILHEAYLETMKELAIESKAARVPSWNKLDALIGGFRPKEFSILCAPTGVGKTTFLANISRQLVEQKHKHFVMSIETGRHDFVTRLMGCFSGHDWNSKDRPVAKNELIQFDSEHGVKFANDYLVLSMHEDRLSLDNLVSELEGANASGHQIAMIDNLNFFMEVCSADQQIQEMDKIIHKLIMFVKSHEMHIIMVMHPRKTEHGRVESEFDIKGSSTAVQEAQNVFLLNRPTKEQIDKYFYGSTDRELKIAKMRRRGVATGKVVTFGCNGFQYWEK